MRSLEGRIVQANSKKGVLTACLLLSLLLAISGCGEKREPKDQAKQEEKSTEPQSIMVGAGAGLKPVLDPVAKVFTEKTGIKIEHSYLCSAMVLTNFQLTKTGDILIPGDTHYMKIAVEKGVIDPKTVITAGYMIPVIAVQKGNPKRITCLEDLAKPGLKLGVGEEEALAVGRLTVKMLQKWGLFDSVMKNVELTAGSATKLIMPLAMGNLDAVINWLPVAVAFKEKVDYIKIEPKKLMYTRAPAGVTVFSKSKDAAGKYLAFLASEEGRAMFKEYGFAAYFDPKDAEEVGE